MQAFLATFLSILTVELTDRTRLVALLLSVRYRAPVQLTSGMTLGYIPAIAVAVWASGFISHVVSPQILKWIVVVSFVGFGAYLLFSREEKEREKNPFSKLEYLGPFWVGFILVAVTEFADKSQWATAGLALKFEKPWPVFWGSLSAQAILNVIYVSFGNFLGGRLPIQFIQWIAGILFLGIGLWVLFAR